MIYNISDMSRVKHVIEHRVATPKVHHLTPLQGVPRQVTQHIIQTTPAQPLMQDAPQKSGFNKAGKKIFKTYEGIKINI